MLREFVPARVAKCVEQIEVINSEIAMKIHLDQIPADGLHLEGEEDCPIPELGNGRDRCAGPAALFARSRDFGGRALGEWLACPTGRAALRPLSGTFVLRHRGNGFCGAHELARTGDDRSHAVHAGRHFAESAGPSALRPGRRAGLQAAGDNRTSGRRAIEKREPDWSALDKLKLK